MRLSHGNNEVMPFTIPPWGRESHQGSCFWGNRGENEDDREGGKCFDKE